MTSSEREMLQNLAHSGGRMHIFQLAKRMGISVDYCHYISMALFRQRLLDQRPHGHLILTATGRRQILGPLPQPRRKRKAVRRAPLRQINENMVRDVAIALTSAVQRSIQRRLSRAPLPMPEEKDAVHINTHFTVPDETSVLETNLDLPAEERTSGREMRKNVRTLSHLKHLSKNWARMP